MKVDWKSKLSSRKFWLSIIGFATSLLMTFGVPDMTIEKITGLITALGALIAYIIAEAYVDGKREEGTLYLNDEADVAATGKDGKDE